VHLALYVLSCLVLFALFVWWRFCVYPVVTCQDLIEILRKAPQHEEEHIGLKEGQTIVGVLETTNTLCFYIGNDVRDEKV
jgi:hypothetical protein